MNKHQHISNNAVLGAPAGWDQDALPCSALPVTRIDWDGQPAVKSYWMPTADELAMLNEGMPIALYVIGQTMTPVAITVEQ